MPKPDAPGVSPPLPLPKPATVALVQASWSRVLPISDAAAALFYDRLFELDPTVRPLFRSDLAAQKKKLMQTLSVAVDGLSNPPRLIPALESLGARHAGYMVEDHHYDLVGDALIWTLREGLGDDFTAEVEAAWREVYALIADVMKKAGAGAHPPPTRATGAAPARAAAPAPPAAAAAAAAAAPAAASGSALLLGPATISSPTPSSLTLALPDRDLTLNVRVQLDSVSAPAPMPAPPPAAALTPGLLLAAVCVAASMAAPLVGARADAPAYGLPLTLLILTAAAFGLGFLWGRGHGGGR